MAYVSIHQDDKTPIDAKAHPHKQNCGKDCWMTMQFSESKNRSEVTIHCSAADIVYLAKQLLDAGQALLPQDADRYELVRRPVPADFEEQITPEAIPLMADGEPVPF